MRADNIQTLHHLTEKKNSDINGKTYKKDN